MNETNPSNENTTAKKRPRRNYDAEFKKAAVEHRALVRGGAIAL